jgi:hypothetical protein
MAPFLLTSLLQGSLARSDAPRVVNVSSMAHLSGDVLYENPHFDHGASYVCTLSRAFSSLLMSCPRSASQLSVPLSGLSPSVLIL